MRNLKHLYRKNNRPEVAYLTKCFIDMGANPQTAKAEATLIAKTGELCSWLEATCYGELPL